MDIFVPGRICLFGEHSDWAGGYRRINGKLEKGHAIIVGTNQGIYAKVDRHPDKLIIKSKMNNKENVEYMEFPMDCECLEEIAKSDSIFNYIAGVAHQVLTHYTVGGLIIDNYHTDLPLKKGLSSSAAICVLTARAFNRVYDLKMTIRGEMEYAYRGEIMTLSRCGRMDQGCAYGNDPILMTFDGDQLNIKKIEIKKDFYYVIVDLKGQKNTIKILTKLNKCFPFQDNDMEEGVKQYLGTINKSIILKAISALENGDETGLGRLMNVAQNEFDRYCIPACPDELNSHLLHKLLNFEPLSHLVLGGKGVGSQGDGSAQLLVRNGEDQEKVISIINEQLGMPCLKLTIKKNKNIRKGLVPAAGFGTRLFPATKAVKKEFFPVIDQTGRMKPAILMIVEELLNSGLEEVGIIIQSEDRQVFEDFFKKPLNINHLNKLSTQDQKYVEELNEIGKKIKFLYQDEQKGFGHAIYCAREWIGDEPFFINLGDHIFYSCEERLCARQLIDIYEKIGLCVVGLKTEPGNNVSNFGCVTGKWSKETDDGVLYIDEFAEKPTLEYASEKLVTEHIPKDHFLTLSGQYILTPLIFKFLEENIKTVCLERGEYQLTSCLEDIRKAEGFYGYIINGQRFDIGLPELYRKTISGFPSKNKK